MGKGTPGFQDNLGLRNIQGNYELRNIQGNPELRKSKETRAPGNPGKSEPRNPGSPELWPPVTYTHRSKSNNWLIRPYTLICSVLGAEASFCARNEADNSPSRSLMLRSPFFTPCPCRK